MAVIIDDLEVVVEQPETTPTPVGPEGAGVAAGREPLAPIDLESVLRQQIERAERVRAH